MTLSIDLPDPLLAKARQQAAELNQPVERVIADCVEDALSRTRIGTDEDDLPVFIPPPGTPAIDPRSVREFLAEEGF